MHILITGTGYVGSIIKRHLEKSHAITTIDRHTPVNDHHITCDLSNTISVNNLPNIISPDIIIHTAGNKNISQCENNPAMAYQSNADTIKNIVGAFDKTYVIYISTDYVFNGFNGRYREHNCPNPSTMYGQSKLHGEEYGFAYANRNFTVLRLSALYDNNSSFLNFLRSNLSQNKPIECFHDTIYSPTYYKDFLSIIDALLTPRKQRIFHACGEPISRYGFATAYAKANDFNPDLIIKASGNDNKMFLFPDQSLDNNLTRTALSVKTTQTEKALSELAKEVS